MLICVCIVKGTVTWYKEAGNSCSVYLVVDLVLATLHIQLIPTNSFIEAEVQPCFQ